MNHVCAILRLQGTYLLTLFVLPTAVFAQGPNLGYLGSFLAQVAGLLDFAVVLLVGLALLLFIWGAVLFIVNAENEDAREEGRKRMVWGVIALFVIVSVWGLVALLMEITGVFPVIGIEAPQSFF